MKPEQAELLETLERLLDAREALYRSLSGGRAKDLGTYLADRERRAEDQENLTEPVLQAILEQLLDFPPDGYVPQLTRDYLKPDFTPSFSVLALWEHAKGHAFPGPELARLDGFVRLFRFRRYTTDQKIRQIVRAPAWREIERREALSVDVDYLVVHLRELSRILADDAAAHAGDLDRRLALRPGRAQALVEELRVLALDLQPSARRRQLDAVVPGREQLAEIPDQDVATDRFELDQLCDRCAPLALSLAEPCHCRFDPGHDNESYTTPQRPEPCTFCAAAARGFF